MQISTEAKFISTLGKLDYQPSAAARSRDSISLESLATKAHVEIKRLQTNSELNSSKRAGRK